MPPEPPVPPRTRQRMSVQKKLLLAGLGLPTLLLLAAAIYAVHRAPVVKLIEEIERQRARVTATLGPNEYATIRIDGTIPSWIEDSTSIDPVSWKFKYFGSIRSIWLTDCRFSEADMRRLGSIRSIEELFLIHQNMASLDELRPLGNLRNLKKLMIETPTLSVDDSSMEWIARLENLEELYIGDAAGVTDRGFALLKKLTKLKKANIGSNKISEVAIQSLQESSPELKVNVTPPINLIGTGVNR